MKYLAFLFLVLSFACGSPENESAANSSHDEETELDDTLRQEEMDDSEDGPSEITINVPPAVVDDACFPYPSEEFIEQLETGSVPYYQASFIYAYLVAHFDSLGPRNYEAVEDEYDMGNYDWSQEFTGGITYKEYFTGEGGPTADIYTRCTNFTAIWSTVNALVNNEICDEHWCGGEWNEDSTYYEPNVGVGCFYGIEKDSSGFYSVSNYCGC